MANVSTRFTRALNLRHPVVSAPMAFAGGGALAAAVSRAGGLGLIGGGYGDPTWLEEQFDAAGSERVGVGFITWSLRKSPSRLNSFGSTNSATGSQSASEVTPAASTSPCLATKA